jgi:hypothetical protein
MQQQIMSIQEENEKSKKEYEETISKLQESNTSKCQELIELRMEVLLTSCSLKKPKCSWIK